MCREQLHLEIAIRPFPAQGSPRHLQDGTSATYLLPRSIIFSAKPKYVEVPKYSIKACEKVQCVRLMCARSSVRKLVTMFHVPK